MVGLEDNYYMPDVNLELVVKDRESDAHNIFRKGARGVHLNEPETLLLVGLGLSRGAVTGDLISHDLLSCGYRDADAIYTSLKGKVSHIGLSLKRELIEEEIE